MHPIATSFRRQIGNLRILLIYLHAVQVAFVTPSQSRSNFNPSLNLVIEEKVEVEMEEYLKCIKALHEKERGIDGEI